MGMASIYGSHTVTYWSYSKNNMIVGTQVKPVSGRTVDEIQNESLDDLDLIPSWLGVGSQKLP